MNPLRHALRDPPRNVGSPEASFAVSDFDNSGLIFKESTNGLFAEVPENSHFLNRIMSFVRQVPRWGLSFVMLGFQTMLDLIS
jgi:hypothetical protein